MTTSSIDLAGHPTPPPDHSPTCYRCQTGRTEAPEFRPALYVGPDWPWLIPARRATP